MSTSYIISSDSSVAQSINGGHLQILVRHVHPAAVIVEQAVRIKIIIISLFVQLVQLRQPRPALFLQDVGAGAM